MITFKIGILGAGHISEKIAETIEKLEGFEVLAVAARDAERAAAFAEKFGIQKSYGSYDELLADPDIELVYVGTINTTHAELAKKCIEAGKPALVEKPFTCNVKTAEEVITLARQKGVFIGEAMWTKYHPMMYTVLDVIAKKLIGEVRYIEAHIGYNLIKRERVVKPELGGSALLDIGIYPIDAVMMFMNATPLSLNSNCMKLETGADAIGTVLMNFSGGRVASVYFTSVADMNNTCIIYGTKGRIEIDNINCPEKAEVFDNNNNRIAQMNPNDRYINGYEYQFIEARNAIIIGKPETPQHTHGEIMSFLNLADMMRVSWNTILPIEGEPTPEDIKERNERIAEILRQRHEAELAKKAAEADAE